MCVLCTCVLSLRIVCVNMCVKDVYGVMCVACTCVPVCKSSSPSSASCCLSMRPHPCALTWRCAAAGGPPSFMLSLHENRHGCIQYCMHTRAFSARANLLLSSPSPSPPLPRAQAAPKHRRLRRAASRSTSWRRWWPPRRPRCSSPRRSRPRTAARTLPRCRCCRARVGTRWARHPQRLGRYASAEASARVARGHVGGWACLRARGGGCGNGRGPTWMWMWG